MDRRMDRRTDRSYFTGPFPATARGQIMSSIKIKLLGKLNPQFACFASQQKNNYSFI